MVVQVCTSIYMLYHSFYFQKYVQVCTNIYIAPTVIISKKYGTGRHAGGSSKWLRVGSKMKVNFSFVHSLTQNFVIFFFCNLLLNLNSFTFFSVLANFYRKTSWKFALYANRNTGKRRAITSVIHFLLLCLFPCI